MLDEMITELIRLGLTEYEARTYAGLVGLGEGTARQVHEACGVPRPRVYDILEDTGEEGLRGGVARKTKVLPGHTAGPADAPAPGGPGGVECARRPRS